MKNRGKARRLIVTKELVLVIVLLLAIGVSGFAYKGITGQAISKLPDDGGGIIDGGIINSYIEGLGTPNYIPKFISSRYIGNSVMYESGGKIGIGTTAPQTNFHINSTNGYNNPVPGIIVENFRNTSTAGAFITAVVGGEGAYDPVFNMYIKGSHWWSMGIDNSDQNKFKISQASGVGLNNKLTITTDGRVGIGTTEPDFNAKLHIQNDDAQESKAVIKSIVGDSWLYIKSKENSLPYVSLQAGNGLFWSLGIDSNDGQKFKISQHSAPTYGTYLSIDPTGRVDIPGTLNVSNVQVSVIQGNITVQVLAGGVGSGNAYVCVTSTGTLFRSSSPCR